MRLVIIGGGYARKSDHFFINQRLAELTGKDNPVVLFIPSAASDDEVYIKEFLGVFEQRLGCQVSVLRTAFFHSYSEVTEAFQAADLIYLGGGNYVNMIEASKQWKIDGLFIDALQSGKLIAGISAGAICWFSSGLRSDYEGDGYAESEGWSILNAVFCPHFNQPDRAEAFASLMEQTNRKGIAIEDDCALYINGNTYEIIGSPESIHLFCGLSLKDLGSLITPFPHGKMKQFGNNALLSFQPVNR
ncbi:peptidase E [Bacillus sp. FJAT-42376]|uniref:Type 1 glutamine amidotransferase-like domain-containing protein n=1 Tax=Bacillus sp. FJAT-42376 TaxID=2014076 RepID=UPI000F511054|nr:Type 1 glutamine amidotransferase-like domain-containing protein [Bacillus sp. FJAT-42376]AZB43433.1 peptidase E [Bacillus sp. FJAT-42376]